ncbi:MAG: hypothetical protein ABIE42_02500 [Candidatus Eisenbacteria bacterium]
MRPRGLTMVTESTGNTSERRRKSRSEARFSQRARHAAFAASSRPGCSRLLVGVLTFAIVLSACTFAWAQNSDVTAQAADSLARQPRLARAAQSVIETTLAGLTLNGRARWERLVLSDLDIVVREDGTRLLPLLRILRALHIDVADSGGSLTFHPEGASKVVLDYESGEVAFGQTSREVTLVVGLSDLTFEPEVYVPDDLVVELLAIDSQWDAQRYEYTLSAERELSVFRERGRTPSLLARSRGPVSIDLPGNLPPAPVDRSLAPRLDFASVRTRSSVITRENDDKLSGAFSPPRLEMWGRVLGGRLSAAVRQNDTWPTEGYSVDRTSWHSCFSNVEVEVGANSLGLSQFAFPSMNLLGARINGSFGGSGDDRGRDLSQMGRRQRYQPTQIVEGYAPLGSEVTLEINGQTVDVQIVEDEDGAPPGEGIYRFDGFNLFTSRLNSVRVIVVAPDGTVDETERQVLGSDQLADEGDMTFMGAVGGRRLPSTDGLSSQGFFAGGRLSYGLSSNLTLGATAAIQDGLYEEDTAIAYVGAESDTLPSKSLHAGSRCVWRPFGPLLVQVEGAGSRVPDTSESDWAGKAGAELHVGGARLYPALFRYGPSFFDGRNAELRDVLGGSASLVWRSVGGNEVAVGACRSRDNLDRHQEETTQLTDFAFNVDARTLIPRSTLSLGTNVLWIGEDSPLRFDVLGLNTGLPSGWSLRSRFVLGDDLRAALRDELPDGSSSRFDRIRRQAAAYDARSALGSSVLGTRVELRRRLSSSWQLALSHRTSPSLTRTSADLTRNRAADGRWQWRLTPGYDWDRQTPYLQNRLEYLVDSGHRNRIVLETQFVENDWFARLSIQMQFDVGFVGNRPVSLGDSYMNPDVGGVKGRVFVDFNGNGLPDDGEPGLEEVDVTSDMGLQVSSKKGGLFVIPNSSHRRGATVGLVPETLPAIYTPTQATQEAILRPGMLTEINLGVGAFGSITGWVRARSDGEEPQGVGGVGVVLVGADGRVVGASITASDGSYYLGEVRPGSYVVTVADGGLPEGLELDQTEIPIDVFPNAEFYEIEDVNLTGVYAAPPEEEAGEHQEEGEGVEYRVFD